MTERTCKACGKTFVLGTRGICSTCRAEGRHGAKPVEEQSRKVRDSVIDLGQAAEELVRAKDEIDAIRPGLLRHQQRAALVEPLARVALVKRFVDGVLVRHGVKVARSEADDEDSEV